MYTAADPQTNNLSEAIFGLRRFQVHTLICKKGPWGEINGHGAICETPKHLIHIILWLNISGYPTGALHDIFVLPNDRHGKISSSKQTLFFYVFLFFSASDCIPEGIAVPLFIPQLFDCSLPGMTSPFWWTFYQNFFKVFHFVPMEWS